MRKMTLVLILMVQLAVTACGSTSSKDTLRTDASGRPIDAATERSRSSADERDGGAQAVADGGRPGETARGVREPSGDASSSIERPARAGPANKPPLKIGLMYSTDTNAALAAIGANTQTGDARKINGVVLDYINKTGGLAGHPLRAAFHNVSATDSSAVISQKACTQWTEDDHVFVAVPAASVQDNNVMRTCLARAGVPSIYPNFYNETPDSEYVKTPLWFETQSLSLEAWARTYVAGLDRQGFFKGSKVGLVYDEEARFTRVAEQVLIPALKKAGANVVSTARSHIHDANDLGSGSSQMSNIALKFRGAGVTHVMFFEVWQGWFMFAQNADSQGWYPTYGFSGQNAMQIMIESGLVPLRQLVGSKLVGWNPGVDTGPPSTGNWPRLVLCKKIFKDAGLDISGSGTQAYHGALASCGGLLALQDGARRAQGPLTAATLRRGLESLGSDLQQANLPAARFGPDRHYAAVSWRPGSYVESCECFRYTGPQTRID